VRKRGSATNLQRGPSIKKRENKGRRKEEATQNYSHHQTRRGERYRQGVEKTQENARSSVFHDDGNLIFTLPQTRQASKRSRETALHGPKKRGKFIKKVSTKTATQGRGEKKRRRGLGWKEKLQKTARWGKLTSFIRLKSKRQTENKWGKKTITKDFLPKRKRQSRSRSNLNKKKAEARSRVVRRGTPRRREAGETEKRLQEETTGFKGFLGQLKRLWHKWKKGMSAWERAVNEERRKEKTSTAQGTAEKGELRRQ